MVVHNEVIVIGAGAGGLVTMKELLDAGFTKLLCLEKQAGPGGLYRNFYYEGKLTTSWIWTAFSTFPSRWEEAGGWPMETVSHWDGPQYCTYLEKFSNYFKLNEYTKYNCGCASAEFSKEDDIWHITDTDGVVHTADRLVVASGTNGEGFVPHAPGQEKFKGDIFHSQDYHHPDQFKGKNVVVVGAGETAGDLARHAGEFGKNVYISLKNGAMGAQTPRNVIAFKDKLMLSTAADLDITPANGIANPGLFWVMGWKEIMGMLMMPQLYPMFKLNTILGGWQNTQFGCKTAGISMAMYYHGAQLKPLIKEFGENTITFENGDTVDADVCVYGTGFCPVAYQFLKPMDLMAVTKNSRAHFKHIFHNELMQDKCAFVGMCRPAFGTVPSNCEMQARYIAGYWSGKYAMPEKEARDEIIKKDSAGEMRLGSAKRLHALLNYGDYVDGMSQLMPDTRIPWNKLAMKGDFSLILKLLIGQCNVAMYRLNGTPEEAALARETIMDTPILFLHHWDFWHTITFSILYCCGVESCRLPIVDKIPFSTRMTMCAAFALACVLIRPLILCVAIPFYMTFCCFLLRAVNPYSLVYLYRSYVSKKPGLVPSDGNIHGLMDYYFFLESAVFFVIFLVATFPIVLPTKLILNNVFSLKDYPPRYRKEGFTQW